MAVDDLFGHSFSFSFCEVVDVANDPTQSGQVRVKEYVGAGQTDQLASDPSNLPWHPILSPHSNPNLKRIGGPHTGIKVGTKVIALNIGKEKQDRIILGTLTGMGTGQPDENVNYDSFLPPHSKQQQVADVQQPNYGDYYYKMTANETANQPQTANQTTDPIWYAAQQYLGIGQQGNTALYADLGGNGKDAVCNEKSLTVGFPLTSS